MTTADRLNALSKLFLWDGDLMRCRSCKRGIHITRINEVMEHRSDCKNRGEENPWASFIDILN